MRIISHRGNLSGPGERENDPDQIDICLKSGFDCEVDLWIENDKFLLGHDFGQYSISFDWLSDRERSLWIHCKNSHALTYLSDLKSTTLNFFWHEEDKYTLTSTKKVWVYPGHELLSDSVAVLPELWENNKRKSELLGCFAICTDYPEKYRREIVMLRT